MSASSDISGDSDVRRNMKIYAGIEGGATKSTTVLVREDGKVLGWVDGAVTNYLLVGTDKCQETIKCMVDEVRLKAKYGDLTLEGLGLGLSGMEDERANAEFVEKLSTRYPGLFRKGVAVSDTIGSVYTACPDGGIVLISGTGSNSVLMNPNGKGERCGGWGHLLGDEGGAYWCARRAIKQMIDTEEGLEQSSYPITDVRMAIFQHFDVKNRLEIIPHFYTTFNKSKIAGFTSKLAELADNGDRFSLEIFKDAGTQLARHVVALSPKIDPSLYQREGGLKIVCVGSVFNSWKYLQHGFQDTLKGTIPEYTMVKMKEFSALGCAFLSSKLAGSPIPMDFSKNYEVLVHVKL